MRVRLILIVFILTLNVFNVFGESDTLLVRDLTKDWVFFDKDKKEFFPLVEKSAFEGSNIFFSLDLEDYNSAILHISSEDQPVSLFVENKLLDIVDGEETSISISELIRKFSPSEVKVTIYSPKLNPYKIKTRLIDIVEEQVNPLGQENIIVLPKGQSAFNDFFVVSCVLLCIFLAFLFNFYPRVLNDFFQLTKAINLREVEENLMKSRPLSQVNILFYLFISLLIGLFLIGIVNFGDFKFSTAFLRPKSILDGLFKWAQTSLILFVAVIVKLAAIHYFTKLYRINGFLNTHFFNYLRLSFVLFSLAIVALVCSQYMFFINEPEHYSFLLVLLFILMTVQILIIYLKLITAVSSKKLHLFSYLCGTELIPFGIILSLGINQTF